MIIMIIMIIIIIIIKVIEILTNISPQHGLFLIRFVLLL